MLRTQYALLLKKLVEREKQFLKVNFTYAKYIF